MQLDSGNKLASSVDTRTSSSRVWNRCDSIELKVSPVYLHSPSGLRPLGSAFLIRVWAYRCYARESASWKQTDDIKHHGLMRII